MEQDTPLTSPLFTATGQLNARIEDFRGKWVVLYFYPKDSTPGCTIEGRSFRDLYPAFQKANAVIFGVSRDTLSSHEKFKSKHQFPFELISDTDEQLCRQFEVLKMKSMFGKSFNGVERSTFLIDPDGKLKKVWRKVKVIGHVAEVLKVILDA